MASSPSLGQSTHSLDVTKHAFVTLSNNDVDGILKDGTDVLKTDSDGLVPVQDIVCDVTLARTGSVGGFADITAVADITTQADLDKVFAQNGFVKAVSSIKRCGGKSGSYAGCARDTMIVEHPGDWRGIVWAHEYGHTASLSHRAFSKALMTSVPLASDQTYVEQAECTAFETGPRGSPINFSIAKPVDEQGDPLIDLVRSVIVDVFPYEAFAAQDPAELPAVNALLDDVAEQANWSNALIAIGIVGAVEEAPFLAAFVAGNVTDGEPAYVYRAKSAALLGLGYLLHRTGSEQALATLREATSAESWQAFCSEQWLGGSEEERAARVLSLQKTALLALALSGSDASRDIVTELAGSAATLGIEPADFDFYLELHQSVAKAGLSAYYSSAE
jgi:hypothetical protein